MVAYRTAGGIGAGNSQPSSLSFTIPATAQAGDAIMVVGEWNTASGTLSISDTGTGGWTERTNVNISNTLTARAFWKVLTSGDIGSTVTVTCTGSGRATVSYGVAAGPVGSVEVQLTEENTNDTSAPFVGITPSGNAVTFVVMAINYAAGGTGGTAPSGWTERHDVVTTNGSQRRAGTYVMTYNTVGSAAVPGGNITTSTNSHNASWTFAVVEPGATPPPESHTGYATLSGGGTVQSRATPRVSVSQSLTGSGATSGSPKPATTTAQTLLGSGQVAILGVPSVSVTTSLTGEGSMLSSAEDAPRVSMSVMAGTGQLSLLMEGASMPTQTFTPPTQPWSIPGKGWWSRYTIDSGVSVVRRDGVLTLTPYPLDHELQALEEGVDYFLGGRAYTVTDEVAAELTSAGFGSGLS